MIKHIVCWDLLVNENQEAVKKELKDRLEGLKDKIPGIIEIEVGYNYNTTESKKDIVLYSVFESKEALNAYQIDPHHVEAATFVKSVAGNRVVVDYEI